MTYLNDLLARVNSASGPDRELDARIHVALFPDEKGMVHPGSPDGLRGSSHGPVCGMDWTAWAKLEAARRGDPLLADHHSWPEYSASLDAALALVERIDPFRVPTGDALHEHVSICASTMEALLNAARLEGVGCCAGCGSTRPIEGLHADGYRSCCPERKILTAKEWAKRAEAAEAALAVVRRSLVEQAAARLDPEMPLVRKEIVAALRLDAEAAYACAETREERIQSHGLSLLCDWQDAARAARQSTGEGTSR